MNKFTKLAYKRKEQADKRYEQAKVAARIGENMSALSKMSDKELRCYNLSQQNPPLAINIKQGISFNNVYSFAKEYHQENRINILDEKIDDNGLTLFWSNGTLADIIKNRKMTEAQYRCCEKVADMMLSGNHDDYFSVKKLKY